MPLVVGVVACELHLPESRSLKDKRRTIRRLTDRIWSRERISVAQTGFHDTHQRAELGFARVSTDESSAELALEALRRKVESEPACVVTAWHVDIITD